MKAPETTTAPIACTLGAGAYQERLAWIAEFNRSALRSSRREGARLILTYDPSAAVRVREMVRRERQCCAFLGFELREDENNVTLVVTAPEAAQDALDAVFDPFLTGSNSAGGCTCATAAP
jgi:hypothetical protein